MAVFAVVTVLGGEVAALIGLILLLVFCAFVVMRTNNTKGLRDVAEVVRAFASIGSLNSRWRAPAPPASTVELDQVPIPKARPAAGVVITLPASVGGGVDTSTADTLTGNCLVDRPTAKRCRDHSE